MNCFLNFQAVLQEARSADQQSDTAQLEKLERLEQEYLRLTHTQNVSGVKLVCLLMFVLD